MTKPIEIDFSENLSGSFPEKSDKLKALDQLFIKSKKYRTSKEYYNLLKFISRFPRLSPFNAFLIHTQNSGVEVVLSANKWSNYGRKIKHNARPLIILIPFGPIELVYDIADTDGTMPIPDFLINPFSTTGILNEKVFHNLINHLKNEDINFIESSMNKASAGFAQYKNSTLNINVNINYSMNEKFSTIVHELGHIYCGHLGRDENKWWKDRRTLNIKYKEIEAESISYLVCKRMGLKTTSESYLNKYIEANEYIPSISLDTILTVSGYIEKMCTVNFKSRNKKNTKKVYDGIKKRREYQKSYEKPREVEAIKKFSHKAQTLANDLVYKFVAKKVYKLGDIVNVISNKYGEDKAKKLLPAIKAGYSSYLINADETTIEKMDNFETVKKYIIR